MPTYVAILASAHDDFAFKPKPNDRGVAWYGMSKGNDVVVFLCEAVSDDEASQYLAAWYDQENSGSPFITNPNGIVALFRVEQQIEPAPIQAEMRRQAALDRGKRGEEARRRNEAIRKIHEAERESPGALAEYQKRQGK